MDSVRCSTSDDPRRRLRHSLEMMRAGRVWVGLHPARANALADAALAAGVPRGLAGYAREVWDGLAARAGAGGAAGAEAADALALLYRLAGGARA